jgi:glycosyltransferase involved in cell wall biosynthesis
MKSIVVPCYNEAENLPALVARFEAERRPDADWELILVDNGSKDRTGEVLAEELKPASRSFVRVVTVPPPNVGYGHGIVAGLRAAKGEYLGWTHADGQTPPADVLKAFDLLTSSADPKRTVVKGLRRGRPLKDTLFTFGMQATSLVLLQKDLPDINGQPKVFHRTLLDLAVAPPVDLSLDLYFLYLARRNGFAIQTFDVEFRDREFGESKWAFNWRSKARNIARSVKFMSALRTGRSYPAA